MQLLVAALDRALALAAGEDGAVVVAQHLDLDVARRRRSPSRRTSSRRRTPTAPRRDARSYELDDVGGLLDDAACRARRRPPPP